MDLKEAAIQITDKIRNSGVETEGVPAWVSRQWEVEAIVEILDEVELELRREIREEYAQEGR